MIGVADGVDHVLDALGTDALGEIDDLAGFRRKGQRVDENAALAGDDQPGVDLDVKTAGEDPGVVGDTRTNDAHYHAPCEGPAPMTRHSRITAR